MFKSQWRTVLTIMLLGLFMLVGSWLALRVNSDVSARVFSSLASSLVALGIAASSKAALEHASNGSGIVGGIATMLTDRKPGEPVTGNPEIKP